MIKLHEADQFDLFGGMIDHGANGTDAYARHSDPETSAEAAESVKTTNVEAIVLEALREFGEDGATSHDLVAQTGMEWQTVSPRMRPLIRKGFAVETDRRRPGPSGRKCIVFVASEFNVEADPP
jgi:DNA-binding MarR family transcriptional regulator